MILYVLEKPSKHYNASVELNTTYTVPFGSESELESDYKDWRYVSTHVTSYMNGWHELVTWFHNGRTLIRKCSICLFYTPEDVDSVYEDHSDYLRYINEYEF